MELAFKKTFGWFLLVIGVLIILWGLWCSFEIFTAKRQVPEIFKNYSNTEKDLAENKTDDINANKNLSIEQRLQQQTQQKMQQTVKEQFEKIMPPEFTSKLFNLISWSIFMGILIFGAGKLAALGISLIK
ncbi:hypothetical protein J7J23_01770 [bacterium]|nr:hypothetical protein [bacterium]